MRPARLSARFAVFSARRAAGLLALFAVATACNAAPAPTPKIPRGGTLHVIDPASGPFQGTSGMRPDETTLDGLQPDFGLDTAELMRCCLGRTLMSYNGQSTPQGGADLRPDLATAPPEVSADGLSWRFHIRRGLHYAPPLQRIEITASDFVRAAERAARVGSGQPFYTDIIGFTAYQQGQAQSIAGLETPDAHTLVVRLSAPEGDLAYRLSLPFLSPLPAKPGDAAAAYGVATGHDAGDGGYIVSSGPYMIDGADKVDFSLPPGQQHPASGLVPGKSITLVRNPSWSSGTDPLREAYADRIVIDYGGTVADAAAAVDAWREDIILAYAPPPQVPLASIRAYEADASKGRVDIKPRDAVRYISMNLAVSPFDDVHVRRAVAFALDRQALADDFGGSVTGAVTGHLALDSMEDDALISYDPFRSADAAARVRMARAEMAQSRYDSNHDGICDAAACRGVTALALGVPGSAAMTAEVQRDLAQIGVQLAVTPKQSDFFQVIGDPTQHIGMALFWAYGKDYPNGADFFVAAFSKDAIVGGANYSLLGATPDQLGGWKYSVALVPSVDDRIDACLPLVGQPQTRCWTSLDQYLVERIAAVIPLIAETYVELIPKRVVSYSFDQSTTLPALDRIAIAH
jgi:peptide/nickel transport system substrate-binding protein